MANPEHLQILKQGVVAWNTWRNQHRDITPDLTKAHLTKVMLGSANLSGADLTGAYLSGADLREVDLREADLTSCILPQTTNLREANLSRADLIGANLTGGDFSWATITDAALFGAVFTGAILTGADFSRALLDGTVFSNTNLTAVRGLETCYHHGPSTLDHRTLGQSGPLPLAFLRGCGLSDWEIEATKLYQPGLTPTQISDIVYRIYSLRADPFIQFYSCFISYASKDRAFAERLHADLQNKGVRCWFAPEDMKIGDRLRPRIDETIRLYDKLLLVLSKTSVASQWVEQEVETALAWERQQGTTILFPVRIDNTVMTLETGWPALIRNTRNIGDFQRWKTHDVYQQAFARLLRDLTSAARQPEA